MHKKVACVLHELQVRPRLEFPQIVHGFLSMCSQSLAIICGPYVRAMQLTASWIIHRSMLADRTYPYGKHMQLFYESFIHIVRSESFIHGAVANVSSTKDFASSEAYALYVAYNLKRSVQVYVSDFHCSAILVYSRPESHFHCSALLRYPIGTEYHFHNLDCILN